MPNHQDRREGGGGGGVGGVRGPGPAKDFFSEEN